MRFPKLLATLILAILAAPAIPSLAFASINGDGLRDDIRWYLHADLAGMRGSAVGRQLYDWLDTELFTDLPNDLGADLGAETDQVTIFSRGEDDAVLAIRGRFSEDTREKLMRLARREAKLNEYESGGDLYYRLRQMDDADFDGYFTFAIEGLLLFTSESATMERLLADEGRLEEREAGDGTLLVVTADRNLVQGGIRPRTGSRDSWESRILEHTREAVFFIADRDGLAAIEAKIVASDPGMALALGGIVGGLIGLQAVAAEEEPALAELLRKTKVTVNEGTVGVSALVEPELMTRLLAR